MKKELSDIVRAISVVPFSIVKVTGVDGDVKLQSRLQDDNTGAILFRGKLKEKVPEFDGVFGFNDIPLLSALVNAAPFKPNEKTDKRPEAKITMKRIERNGVKIPEEIVFEKDGFGKLSYRLTSEKAVPQQMIAVADIEWNVEIEGPSQKTIGNLQLAASLPNLEPKFSIKTENRQVKFLIGDENAANHKGVVIFAEEVAGTIKPNHTWNITAILSVLKLGSSGKTSVKISDQGIIQIEIDTGIGVYTYIFAGTN